MIYKHFKGKYYLKLFTATDCETMKNVVVYMSLYKGEFNFWKVWVRDEDDFNGEHEVHKCKRFEKVKVWGLVKGWFE